MPEESINLLKINSQQLTGPPPGFDSVYGQVGGKLNYPEIVVYNPDAVMPRYIIVYRKAEHLTCMTNSLLYFKLTSPLPSPPPPKKKKKD